MTNMLAAALKYARHGTPIFPCDPTDKSPLCPHGFHDATTKEYQIRAWWRRWPNAMIGMPTGPRTRVWVLDVDALTSPIVFLMRPLIGYTAMSTTPRGGWHFFSAGTVPTFAAASARSAQALMSAVMVATSPFRPACAVMARLIVGAVPQASR